MSFYRVKLDDDLELAQFVESEADELFELTDRNRAHLRAWLGWLDSIKSPADTLEFIQAGQEQVAGNDGIQIGIRYKGKLIGAIGLHYLDWERKQTEVGYWLDKDYEGRGIVTRACRALVDYAFLIGMEVVLICCATENGRSQAVPERLGFLYWGMEPRGEFLYDHYVDLRVYRMAAADWLSRNLRRLPANEE
jgi:ribosomal-protein-serine acetyltransferase